MPAPLAALGGIFGKGALMGGRAALAGAGRQAAMGAARQTITGGIREGVRGAARGAVKRTLGGRKGKMKSPLREGESGTVKGGGGGGGAIVPRGGALVPAINTSAIVPAPKSETVVAKKSSSGDEGDAAIISSLDNIKSLLEQIVSIEEEEQKNIKDRILSASREKERAARDAEQEKQEEDRVRKARKKPENPIVKGAKKAVKGIWGLISDFVKDFILYKILDWFGDPKNKKNVQRIVEFFQGAIKFFGAVFEFISNRFSEFIAVMGPALKIFGAFLTPLLDLITLKWLTNPEEFLKNILNIPKVLFEAIPELFKALANFISFGLFNKLGEWVGNILSNFNPLKLLGFGGDDKETVEGGTEKPPVQEKPKENSGGGMMSMLNPMNWFGGGDKQTVDTESLPKLKEGGIVSPPAGANGVNGTDGSSGANGVNGTDGSSGSDGVDGAKGTDAKSLTQGSVTVHPLEKIVDVAGISENLTKAMKPFMDMMVAPFKIIGTAIVGLILKTVSKIPFVGNIIEPIIRMAASTFGVPTNVLTQLKSQTKEDREIKEVDKEKLLEKFSESITNVKESVEIAKKEGGGNVFESFFSGAGQVMGGISNFLGNLIAAPAQASSSPLRSPSSGSGITSGSGTTSGGGSSSPPMQSFASHAEAGKAGASTYKNTETGKVYSKSDDGYQEVSGGGIVEYITGDRSHSGYRTDHGGGNYHDHIAFDSKETRDAAVSWLQSRGWVIGSMNDGKHANTSYHYTDQAFDIPFYPNQSNKGFTDDAKGETGLSSLLRKDLAEGGFLGAGVKGTPVNANIADTKTGETPGSEMGTYPRQAQLTTKPSGSGQELQNTQQESLQLQSSSRTSSSATPTIIDMGGGQNKSTVQSSTQAPQSLGSTLPTNGLWAVFKTNL